MFHITKETVGSAYFTCDGIHLSAIGTYMVTSFLTGFNRSLHTLSQDDKKEMHDIKQRHHNQRPQHQNHKNFQNSRLPNGPTRSYPNRNTGQNANNYQHPNRHSNRYGEQFQNWLDDGEHILLNGVELVYRKNFLDLETSSTHYQRWNQLGKTEK